MHILSCQGSIFSSNRPNMKEILHVFPIEKVVFVIQANGKSWRTMKYQRKLKKKYLVINLTKEVGGLYTKNYKTLIKEIEDDSKNGNTYIPCSQTRRIDIVKMAMLPKAVYRFNATPVKLLVTFFLLEQIFYQN